MKKISGNNTGGNFMLFRDKRFFIMKLTVAAFLLFTFFSSFTVTGQIKEFDNLEMLYAQGYYKMVYRKANRLLDKPDYDFSKIPMFYKSLSLFHLAENSRYFKRNSDAYDEARRLFLEVKNSSDGYKIFNAHLYEVSVLKQDLFSRAEDLKRRDKKEEFEALHSVLVDLFENVPSIDVQGEVSKGEIAELKKPANGEYNTERDKIAAYAMNYVGVPYVWAGNTPNGFDCSGFTSYVMKNFGKSLPRRSADQYENSRKLKQNKVQKGDLVFFDSGNGISHVGMIISEQGQPLVMIHASSSKGIIVTEIEKSDYWLKRLSSFGTYVD